MNKDMENYRNLLVAGSKKVGKSALLVTLARGVCPPDGAIPGRFEGWTISVFPRDFEESSELKRTNSNSSTSSVSIRLNINNWPTRPNGHRWSLVLMIVSVRTSVRASAYMRTKETNDWLCRWAWWVTKFATFVYSYNNRK